MFLPILRTARLRRRLESKDAGAGAALRTRAWAGRPPQCAIATMPITTPKTTRIDATIVTAKAASLIPT